MSGKARDSHCEIVIAVELLVGKDGGREKSGFALWMETETAGGERGKGGREEVALIRAGDALRWCSHQHGNETSLARGTGHENVLRPHCQRRLHSDVEAPSHVPRHFRTSTQPLLTYPRSVMHCLHCRILSLAGWLQLNTRLPDWATMYARWDLQTPLCASAPGISAQLFSNPLFPLL